MEEFRKIVEAEEGCHLTLVEDMKNSKRSCDRWLYSIRSETHPLFDLVPRAVVEDLFRHFCPYYPRDTDYICGNKLALIAYSLPIVSELISGLFQVCRSGVEEKHAKDAMAHYITGFRYEPEYYYGVRYFIREVARMVGFVGSISSAAIITVLLGFPNIQPACFAACWSLGFTRYKHRLWNLQDDLNMEELLRMLFSIIFFARVAAGPPDEL